MSELGFKISFNIRKIMKEKGIKHFELAKELGKTQAALSSFFTRLERGGASNVKNLEEIAKVLNVDISNFFC